MPSFATGFYLYMEKGRGPCILTSGYICECLAARCRLCVVY